MAEAAAAPATEAIASTSSAQAKFEAAKAHPLPSVATIKELFERFDFNKNKVLSLAEIDKAVREIMPEYADNKEAMMRSYKSADLGKNGFVELHEFSDFVVLLKYYNEIGQMFKAMNVNNDQRITYDEFEKYHKIAGLDVPAENIKVEFEKISMGGPAILFEEFTTYMAKRTAAPDLAVQAAQLAELQAASAPKSPAKKAAAKAAGKTAAKPASPAKAAAKSPAKSPAKASPVRSPQKAKAKAGLRSTITPGGKDAADRTTTAKAALSEEDKQRGDACYDRLTNPKNFHGIYRERFKEKGLIEGEESSDGSPKKPSAKPAGLRTTVTPGGKNAADRTTTAKTVLSEEDKQRGDACYDRLTNPKNFHGIYRERFKEKGLIEGEEPCDTSPKKPSAKPAGLRTTVTPGGKNAADRTTTAKTVLSEEDKQRGDACYDRLTNPKNFHGIYRERFKEKGLIEGEESSDGSPKKPSAKPAGLRTTVTPGGKNAADRTTTAKTMLSEEDKQRGDACYDRLTNPKNFHGIYRERFKEKGLIEGEGDKSPVKSPVRSPSKPGAKASPARSPAGKASPKKSAASAAIKAGAKPKPIIKPAAAAAAEANGTEHEATPPSSPAPAAASPAPAASSPAPDAVSPAPEPASPAAAPAAAAPAASPAPEGEGEEEVF